MKTILLLLGLVLLSGVVSAGWWGDNDSDGDGDAMMDIAEPTSPYPAASDLLQEAADEGSDDMDLMMSPSGLMA